MPEILDQKGSDEVVAAVQAEIAKLGKGNEAIKKNHEELQKSLAEVHSIVEKHGQAMKDPITKESFDKLCTDVATRQEESDKKIHERLDGIEVASKRSARILDQDGKEIDLSSKSKELKLHQLAVGRKTVSAAELDAMEISEKDYQDYTKTFDKYLRTKSDDFLSEVEKKTLIVGSDPDGGYTVTPEMSSKIVQRLFEMDPIRQLATVQTIGTDAIEFMEDIDEAGAAWESETVITTNKTTPQMNKKRISVHPLATRPKISQQLLEDSSINITSWLANKVAEKFARTEGNTFVDGTGVGQPRGFLDYSDWTTAGVYDHGKIERTNMGHATTLTTDGFTDVMYSMIEQHLFRGTWLMNRLAVRDTMKLKDGDGQYIWRAGLEAGQPSTILAAPVRMSTNMPSVAAGALAVAFADWKEAYMIVDRLGISVQRDPFTAKPLVEFYHRKRVGGDVVNYQAIKIGVVAA